jgi:hypothetical protein
VKGIVFNLLEDAVTSAHGADTWDAILDETGASGVYTALGNYPDEEALALVGALCDHLGAPPETVLRAFGQAALPALVERYPEYIDTHATTKSFLMTLDDTVHRDVVKLYPDAKPPRFTFEDRGEKGLVMHYASERRLCSMAEGMIQAAAERFGETARIEHPVCMLEGAERCTLVVTFG